MGAARGQILNRGGTGPHPKYGAISVGIGNMFNVTEITCTGLEGVIAPYRPSPLGIV